jgi:hypothetical protein
MRAEASTILRAVAADFFFNCWYLEIPSDNRIQHIPNIKKKLHGLSPQANYTERPPLVGEVIANFCG